MNRRRVVLDTTPVTVLAPESLAALTGGVPMVPCPRCGQPQPSRDGTTPLPHGRPTPDGPVPCR